MQEISNSICGNKKCQKEVPKCDGCESAFCSTHCFKEHKKDCSLTPPKTSKDKDEPSKSTKGNDYQKKKSTHNSPNKTNDISQLKSLREENEMLFAQIVTLGKEVKELKEENKVHQNFRIFADQLFEELGYDKTVLVNENRKLRGQVNFLTESVKKLKLENSKLKLENSKLKKGVLELERMVCKQSIQLKNQSIQMKNQSIQMKNQSIQMNDMFKMIQRMEKKILKLENSKGEEEDGQKRT